jgi:protein-S-isoprenylcysteine O-methyltransferase Ste14
MSDSNPASTRIPASKVFARLGQSAILLLILGTDLFLAAGRLDWPEAWAFLAVYLVVAEAAALWMLYRDPALSEERSRRHQDAKPFDRIIIPLNLVLTLAQWAAIGLDAGRFGWSTVPVWLRILGGLAFIPSFGLTLWASRVNTVMSSQVRIQRERGHRAVVAGPYRLVRHPMYLGMILLDIGLPLLLGSFWALTVSGAMIVLVVVRTALEDRALQAELPGYSEFVAQTPYRLFPGVW